LDKTNLAASMEKIGMDMDTFRRFRAAVDAPHGLLLVTGPTGSGKTTTLYSALNELNCTDYNIVTVEDPVEFQIQGINQVPVRKDIGLTFGNALRSILRQDPDIIMIGEIRDTETAEIAVESALTGHQVLSTMHCNDAPGAIARMDDMGIAPFLISSSVILSCAQRLIRKICPKCREAYHPSEEELNFFGMQDDGSVTFYRGAGCPECAHTGYLGRQAVFEILVLNREEKSLINRRASHDQIVEAVKRTNFVSMKENCRSLVLRGATTMQEVFKVINSTED
jgi:type II secretory ATPase GspE/PulE/Tfp pilus assembly ATPase PilB-like protein